MKGYWKQVAETWRDKNYEPGENTSFLDLEGWALSQYQPQWKN